MGQRQDVRHHHDGVGLAIRYSRRLPPSMFLQTLLLIITSRSPCWNLKERSGRAANAGMNGDRRLS
jgi:hypothetical protein